ncbi:MAG TPA: hypothetical protein VGL29_07100 [Blastocatellia bacterium]
MLSHALIRESLQQPTELQISIGETILKTIDVPYKWRASQRFSELFVA